MYINFQELKGYCISIFFKMADQKPVVRPRFAAEELGIKEKLVVAVITNSSSVLRELGPPVNKTLAHHIDKLIFFLDDKPIADTNLPIVTFPQKKFKPYQFVSDLFKKINLYKILCLADIVGRVLTR